MLGAHGPCEEAAPSSWDSASFSTLHSTSRSRPLGVEGEGPSLAQGGPVVRSVLTRGLTHAREAAAASLLLSLPGEPEDVLQPQAHRLPDGTPGPTGLRAAESAQGLS